MSDPNTPHDKDSQDRRNTDNDFTELSDLIRADLPEPGTETSQASNASLRKDETREARLEAELAELKSPPPVKPKKRRSWLSLLLFIALLIAVAGGGASWWVYRSFHTPVEFNGDQLITIKAGSSA